MSPPTRPRNVSSDTFATAEVDTADRAIACDRQGVVIRKDIRASMKPDHNFNKMLELRDLLSRRGSDKRICINVHACCFDNERLIIGS